MTILDGQTLSQALLQQVARQVAEKKLQLTLAVILVGENAVSKSYIGKKKEACEQAGIHFELFEFPLTIDEATFRKEVKKIIDMPTVSGVVIQLPLPKHFVTEEILNMIPRHKDIDVLSVESFQAFADGKSSILPPVVGAVKALLEKYQLSFDDKKVVILGRGRLVGKPLSVWFAQQGIDFAMIGREVENPLPRIKDADVVLSGIGSPSFITNDMVKEGVTLIDVGTASEDGKVKGDIDQHAFERATYVAPVPGGVGPMTVAILVQNLVTLVDQK